MFLAVLQGFEGSTHCHLFDDTGVWMRNSIRFSKEVLSLPAAQYKILHAKHTPIMQHRTMEDKATNTLPAINAIQ